MRATAPALRRGIDRPRTRRASAAATQRLWTEMDHWRLRYGRTRRQNRGGEPDKASTENPLPRRNESEARRGGQPAENLLERQRDPEEPPVAV